jgi:hypothetical protein
LKKDIFYKKLKHRLFQICVKKVSFLLILFVLGILCAYAIASNTYTGKYLMIDGVVRTDSHNNSEIRIKVDPKLVPGIEKEKNIKWYVSVDNIRRKAVLKEIYFDEEGACNLVLSPKDNDKYNIGADSKVYVILMYGRKYVF